MKARKYKIAIREAVAAIKDTILSLLSWLIGYPLTLFIERDINLILVLCRPHGMFADNSKYFFVYASDMIKTNERIFFLTSDHKLQEIICKAGGKAIIHPSLHSLLMLLKCGTIFTDLFISGYYPFTRGAKLVQIWHGAPLKHIELDVFHKRLANSPFFFRIILRMQKLILGRYPTYDIVVSTSQNFIQKAFQSCFKARQFVATGYPRNDILFGWPKINSLAWRLAWINVDKKAMNIVEKAKSEGKTICLYAPTHRSTLSDPFESVIDLFKLSEFARENNILIVLKLHPFMHGKYRISNYAHLLEYDPHGDIYPLMAISDILITDYSSIYFDYLLLDRPILFFAYDLESYLEEDRQMYFDYESMTPGIKCRNQQELEQHLKNILSKKFKDDFSAARKIIKTFTHDHDDNQSCWRLIQEFSHSTKSRKN